MDTKLSVDHININALKPSLYNPRKWSDEAIKQLTLSIEKFGLATRHCSARLYKQVVRWRNRHHS